MQHEHTMSHMAVPLSRIRARAPETEAKAES